MPRIERHALPLARFEALTLAGHWAREGRRGAQHTLAPLSLHVTSVGGTRAAIDAAPAALAVGETLERAWRGERGGLPNPANMRAFTLTECCHKPAADRLEVTDSLHFHSRASCARRAYSVRGVGAGIERRAGTWQVGLAGLPGLLRRLEGQVRARMLPALGEIDASLTQLIDQAAAAPPTPAASAAGPLRRLAGRLASGAGAARAALGADVPSPRNSASPPPSRAARRDGPRAP